MRTLIAFGLSLMLFACNKGVEGTLVDARSAAPLSGVDVMLVSSGPGRRDGQFVIDADKSERTTTDDDGRFAFARSGGSDLVFALDGQQHRTSVCSRTSLYRLNGPYDGLPRSYDQVVDADGKTGLGATITGWQDQDAERRIRVDADHGVAHVAGGGAIPVAPDVYRPRWEGDPLDCGFLFVKQRDGGIAVIRLGNWATAQEPGQPVVALLDVTMLPASTL